MAALLRGFARTIVVAAARQPGAAASTLWSSSSTTAATVRRAAGGGGSYLGSPAALATARKGERVTVMASFPGLCGSGLLHPLPVLSGAQQQHPLSSSAAIVSCHLCYGPQERWITLGSKQASAFQRKFGEGQVTSVDEADEEAISYREQIGDTWTPASISDRGSAILRTRQVRRNLNARGGSVSSLKPFGDQARRLSTSVSTNVLQESEVYRKSPSLPFQLSREFSSSALLAGFDDSEGSDMDVETYKRMHEITTTGENVPDPVMTFASTGFPPTLMRELRNAGFSSPSAIQAMTWPIASQNRDVVAVAKTGSGKTLGYLIPSFLRLGKERPGRTRNPSVLILAPTRELANQIRDETWKFGRSSRISCTCVCGGASRGPQLRDIARGVDVIVATPGRLNDLLEMGAVNLQKVSYLVLDEADRMLDMGFEPQIRAIVDQMRPQRQTLMYTATWPHEVRRIARDLLNDPVQVNIGDSNQLSANKDISQIIEIISRYDKEKRLDEILEALDPESKVLIFCTTKRMCDELAMNIRNKFGALAIHGDKSQRERDYVMNQFKRGRTSVLVATDVAARGLDIKEIRMVINYDFPTGVEDYVHRIGRTGRAGATGVAHTFFGYEDAKHARDLIKVLESSGQVVSQDLRQMGGRGDSKRGGFSRYGGRGGGQRSQQGYYTGRSDGYSKGSKWGQNNHSGGDRNGNRLGSGNDRFGTGNGRFGGRSDRFANRPEKFGSGSDRFGTGRFSTVNRGGRYGQFDSRVGTLGWSDKQGSEIAGSGMERGETKSFERPPDFGRRFSLSHQNLAGVDGIDKQLFTPRYEELKMNSNESMSLW